MSGRRARIEAAVNAVTAHSSRVLGAAVATQARARHALTTVLDEIALLDADPDARPRDLASEAHQRVAQHRAEALAGWGQAGPELAARAVHHGGSAAVDPPDVWIGQVGKALDPTAELWRIGAAHIPALPGVTWPAAVPLLDHAHLNVQPAMSRRNDALHLVEGLVLRVLHHHRPGLVRVHLWDAGQIVGALPSVCGLLGTGLLSAHSGDQLGVLLTSLAARVGQVRGEILAAGRDDLTEHRAQTGQEQPWHVAVLIGDGTPLSDPHQALLARVLRGGAAAGVHLIVVDIPGVFPGPVETVRLGPHEVVVSTCGVHARVDLDPPTNPVAARGGIAAIGAWWEQWCTRSADFRDLLPAGPWGTESSRDGLVAPVGFDIHGQPVNARLDDLSPHALSIGPTGAGKSNFLTAWLGGLCSRYSPDELEVYVLDFKDGVSFAQLAPSATDQTWLPHARLVGVNINTDREFGLDLLQFLVAQMRYRAAAEKARGVSKLADLRKADPAGRWPRIVTVIDEFQGLLAHEDRVAKSALALIDEIARKGRSHGIHLVLATQNTTGIKAMWGQQSILEQFVLRIGLPRAKQVMAGTNDVCLALPAWHAVVNHESGQPHGNQVARIPCAVEPGQFDELQRQLWEEHGDQHGPPRLLDGDLSPAIAALQPAGPGPIAVLGQAPSGGPAYTTMRREPGRNLAVIGSPSGDAATILAAATVSLAQSLPGCHVVVATPTGRPPRPIWWAAERTGAELVVLDGAWLTAELAQLSTRDRPRLLVLADAPDATTLDRDALKALQRLLHDGPARGVHLLGWWGSVQRLRSILSGALDDIGTWVACDVYGGELGSLIPGNQLNAWTPRPGRAMWLDRSVHAAPNTLVVPSLDHTLEAA